MTAAFTKAINTSKLPISLAILDNGWYSSPIRSITVSMAVLASSISKMMNKEKTINNFKDNDADKKMHAAMPKTKTAKSCLKAASDLNAAKKPS